MSRKRLNVDWGQVEDVLDLNPYLKRYESHLYLKYAETNRPTTTDFEELRETLHQKNLSRGSKFIGDWVVLMSPASGD